jgi:serine protease Do
VNTLRNTVAQAGSGADVTLTIFRNGSTSDIKVKLTEFNPQTASSGGGSAQNPGSTGHLGIQVTPLTPDLASQVGAPRGTQGVVVESVDPSGPAGAAGIQMGDVIEQVNHQAVRNSGDVTSALAKSGGRPALMQVMRNGRSVFIAVPLNQG